MKTADSLNAWLIYAILMLILNALTLRRNAAAKAFDSHWDNLMFRLVKAGRMLAQFNQKFAEERQPVSNLITLLQRCIDPEESKGKIYPKQLDPIEDSPSYAEELAQLD